MDKARSSDGTEIAFDRLGDGPPVILVSGASCARGIHGEPAELLATDFTVLNHDRRGRGDSGDAQPYAVEREIDDIAAVITAEGGAAAVFGNSSNSRFRPFQSPVPFLFVRPGVISDWRFSSGQRGVAQLVGTSLRRVRGPGPG